MKNNLLEYYITVVFFFSTVALCAQPGSGSDTDPLEGADQPLYGPIDSYVWILAVVGLLFVFMKFRANYKNKIQG